MRGRKNENKQVMMNKMAYRNTLRLQFCNALGGLLDDL